MSDATVYPNVNAGAELLVDKTGNALGTSSNPLYVSGGGGGGSSSDVALHDNNTPSQHATIDASGNLHTQEANSAGEKSDLDTIVTQTANVAKETGGNLAAAKSDLDTIATNTTGVATAANQATANTSLGSIATNTSNTATNTSGAKSDLDTLVSGVNINKWNGSTPGASNPVLTEDQIRAYIANGQGFTAFINGNVTAGNAAAISLFANNISKTVVIFRVTSGEATAGSNCKLARQGSDFALGAGGAAAMNLNSTSATSSLVTISSSIAAASAGTTFDYTLLPAYIPNEILENNEVIIIPAGAVEAVAAFTDCIATNGAGFVSISWLEI